MQSSEKFCLKWNDFQENLNSAFEAFRKDEDFADVTLVCEDGTKIDTHKVILAISSPFFMKILKKNKHPHPLIYMKGSKAAELLAMVDFLYYGEANVDQESLDAFLGLAEELKLKGLTGSPGQVNSGESRTKRNTPEEKIEARNHLLENSPKTPKQFNIYNSDSKTEQTTVALVSVMEAGQLDEQIKSMMTMTENEVVIGGKKRKAYACNVCGKEGQPANIMNHIEANHIDSNISHSCDICGKISRSRPGLQNHKSREHLKQTFLQV